MKILSLEAQSRPFLQASIEEMEIGGKPEQFASLAKALRSQEKGSANSIRRPCEFSSQTLRSNSQALRTHFAGLAKWLLGENLHFASRAKFRKPCEIHLKQLRRFFSSLFALFFPLFSFHLANEWPCYVISKEESCKKPH